MKKRMLCGFVVMLLCSLGAAAHADMFFRTILTGDQEVPPNDSEAMGHGSFVLKDDLTFIAHVHFHGLESDFLAAHIHNAPAGVNGPVLIPLQLQDHSGGHDHICMHGGECRHLFGMKVLTELEKNEMLAGNFYANVHSVDLPGGEIRGQIEPVPEPGSLAALLTMGGLSALGYLKRRVS